MSQQGLQVLGNILSAFGFANPRQNPDFNPSNPDSLPQLVLDDNGAVIGVSQPTAIPRFAKPTLLERLAGNPAAQMNAERANYLTSLSAQMYMNAKMAELNHKYNIGEISAKEAADKAVAIVSGEQSRQTQKQAEDLKNYSAGVPRFSVATENNEYRKGENEAASSSGRAMSVKGRTLESAVETDRLKADAVLRLFQNPKYTDPYTVALANMPLFAKNDVGGINLATGAGFMLPRNNPITNKTTGFDKATGQMVTKETSTVDTVPGMNVDSSGRAYTIEPLSARQTTKRPKLPKTVPSSNWKTTLNLSPTGIDESFLQPRASSFQDILNSVPSVEPEDRIRLVSGFQRFQ